MRTLAVVIGLLLIAACFQDIFEAVLLPRRIDRQWRFMVFFYRFLWRIWSSLATRLRAGRRRESVIAIFGPFSMMLLFALWGLSLILGFGLIQWALPARSLSAMPLSRQFDLSADAFFTLGIENLAARSQLSLVLIFLEAGTGFGYIALMVSYLPVLYTHFAQRDARLVQLDARAGTPAAAGTVLLRYAALGDTADLELWLADWEHWAADLVETHSAYPMLAFYRSQHENQSWLATLAVVMDVTTLLLAVGPDEMLLASSGAFLAARRVVEEICISLGVDPLPKGPNLERVSEQDRAEIIEILKPTAWKEFDRRVEIETTGRLVATYESRLQALSSYLLLPLPKFLPQGDDRTDSLSPNIRLRLVERLIRSAAYAREQNRSRRPPN